MMTDSKLLKSWAIPPASCPKLSSRSDWRSRSPSARRSASAFLSSVKSRDTLDIPVTTPLESRIGEMVMATSRRLPSLRARFVSSSSARSPRRTRSRIGVSSPARSCGMSSEMLRPMISVAG